MDGHSFGRPGVVEHIVLSGFVVRLGLQSLTGAAWILHLAHVLRCLHRPLEHGGSVASRYLLGSRGETILGLAPKWTIIGPLSGEVSSHIAHALILPLEL